MFFDNFAAMGLRRQATLLDSDAWRVSSTPDSAYAPRARTSTRRPRARGTLDRLLYTDIKTYLVELLMKQDQMSMAASIESRVPFLDHHLVEFATALAPRMKLRGLTTKWILRQAVKDSCPARSSIARRWASPCRSRSGCAARGRTPRATCSSIGARASGARRSSGARAADAGARGRHRRGR